MRTFLLIIVAAGLLLTVFACTDHRIPPTASGANFRLKRTANGVVRSGTVVEYFYRPDGKVAHFYRVSSNTFQPRGDATGGQLTTLQYNAQGQLVSTQSDFKDTPTFTYKAERSTLTYNASGQLVSEKVFVDSQNNGNYSLSYEARFTYDGVNQLPTRIVVYDQSVTVIEDKSYRYTNGNVYMGDSDFFIYDNTPNPLYSLAYLGYRHAQFVNSFQTVLSKNNLKSGPSGSGEIQISYNEQGLINGTMDRGTGRQSFEYEQY